MMSESPPAPVTFILSDLGSKNGTFVEGVRVDRPVALRDGAIIFLGDHVAVFRLVSLRALDAIEVELGAPFGPVATVSSTLAAGGHGRARVDVRFIIGDIDLV